MTVLQNARVLVVGASGGLGTSIADECLKRGARVVGTSHAHVITNSNITSVVADITSAQGRRAITAKLNEFGGVDVVLLAAGVVGFGIHDTVSPEHIAQLINVDLVAQLQLITDISPLIAEGGNVTCITGAVVDVATLGMSAYTAAKAGLSAAAAVIRRELRARKISVLDARPPHTETGLATRAVFGSAPALKPGIEPTVVARHILDAVENDVPELPPTAFTSA